MRMDKAKAVHAAMCLGAVVLADLDGAPLVESGAGAWLLLAASAICFWQKSYQPVVISLLILATAYPVAWSLGTFDHASGQLAQMSWGLGAGLLVWGLGAIKIHYGGAGLIVVLSVALANLLTAPDGVSVQELNLGELERNLLRGDDEAMTIWVERAMSENVGPNRLRQMCEMRDWDLKRFEETGPYSATICRAVLRTFPEHGARELLELGEGRSTRLAADLFAEAGLWGPAARATKLAVAQGAPLAALNLWRWRVVKGRISAELTSWDAWNAELNFQRPAGAERSAIRITRTPGDVKPLHLDNDQRAVMLGSRYRDSFTVVLPKPPKIAAQTLRLFGSAQAGFALEMRDAIGKWHRFTCGDSQELSNSSFCMESMGELSMAFDESIPQPLRQIRLRGQSIVSKIEMTPR